MTKTGLTVLRPEQGISADKIMFEQKERKAEMLPSQQNF